MARQQFAEMMGFPDSDIDLSHASLLIACAEYPDLDVPACLGRLDAMACRIRESLSGAPGAPELMAAISHYLFEQEGFSGDTEDYYDPRNSFLNDVLDRKRGIPITLSMLYMEVARRLGLTVFGIGLPGHFIVKVQTPGAGLLLDPFYRGAVLTEADCQKRLDRIHGGRVQIQPALLAACQPKAILARMLRNLKAIYTRRDDPARALRILDLLLAITPRRADDLRDRGRLYAAIDCYALAARDFESCLELAPAADADALRAEIAILRHKAKHLN